MGTFKIKQTVETEKEVEINGFPHFRGSQFCWYKVLNEDKCIRIGQWSPLSESIEFQSAHLAFDDDTWEITEGQFKEKFNEVLSKLSI